MLLTVPVSVSILSIIIKLRKTHETKQMDSPPQHPIEAVKLPPEIQGNDIPSAPFQPSSSQITVP